MKDNQCEHEWTNIRIPGDDGVYVACLKCKSVDVEETRRLSRSLIRKKVGRVGQDLINERINKQKLENANRISS